MDHASIDAWVLGMFHPSAFGTSKAVFLVDPVAVNVIRELTCNVCPPRHLAATALVIIGAFVLNIHPIATAQLHSTLFWVSEILTSTGFCLL